MTQDFSKAWKDLNEEEKAVWEDICKKKLYEKRITLSVSDLKKTNWMVRYP